MDDSRHTHHHCQYLLQTACWSAASVLWIAPSLPHLVQRDAHKAIQQHDSNFGLSSWEWGGNWISTQWKFDLHSNVYHLILWHGNTVTISSDLFLCSLLEQCLSCLAVVLGRERFEADYPLGSVEGSASPHDPNEFLPAQWSTLHVPRSPDKKQDVPHLQKKGRCSRRPTALPPMLLHAITMCHLECHKAHGPTCLDGCCT